jgi:DNA-directed RNA polymerase specialized sigma24 family protein
MNIVNPINFLGRFGWRDLQINHNRFLAAPHEHTAQRFLPAGVDLLMWHKGWHINKIARAGVGDILKALAPPQRDSQTLNGQRNPAEVDRLASDLIELSTRALAGVDRLKGKFRSFLLASFQNHLSDQIDRARRFKRGGDKEFIELDAEEAEERYRLEPAECLTAEKLFDARWAMTLLAVALNRLGQEYANEGKTSTFEALKAFLDPANSGALPTYEEVANRLRVSTGAVKTLIHRLRKRYTPLLREEVGRTVSDPAEIDEEIHALCEAFIASEGRLSP